MNTLSPRAETLLAGFDEVESPILPVLPRHLAWNNGTFFRSLSKSEMIVGRRRLRPATTLEAWIIYQFYVGKLTTSPIKGTWYEVSEEDDCVSDFDLDEGYCSTPATTSRVPIFFLHRKALANWLNRHNLSPPIHIFNNTASFVAEELTV